MNQPSFNYNPGCLYTREAIKDREAEYSTTAAWDTAFEMESDTV